MAGIRFTDYYFNELSYKMNPNFNHTTTELNITPALELGINISKSKSEVITKLAVTLGDFNSEDTGFVLAIEILGMFEYDDAEIQEYNIQFETFIKESTISILWSFIRPTVSDIITRGNRFPNYILPVVNVKKMIEENPLDIFYTD